MLVILCCMLGVRHCLVQDWGEVGWSKEIQLINSIVVSIQYTLHDMYTGYLPILHVILH